MKTLKTIAFASLVAFSSLAFTACDGKKTSEAAEDAATEVEVATEDLLEEAGDASENMMNATEDAVNDAGDAVEEAGDSTKAAVKEAVDATEEAVEEATK